jgi:hypothetical protein
MLLNRNSNNSHQNLFLLYQGKLLESESKFRFFSKIKNTFEETKKPASNKQALEDDEEFNTSTT